MLYSKLCSIVIAFLIAVVAGAKAIAQNSFLETETCYKEILDSEDSDTASIIFYNQPNSEKFRKCGPVNKQAFSNIVKNAFYSEALMFQRDSESYALEITEKYNRYIQKTNLVPIVNIPMDTWYILGESLGYAITLNVNTGNVVHNEQLMISLQSALQKMSAQVQIEDEIKIDFAYQYLHSFNLKLCEQSNVCERVFYSLTSFLNANPRIKHAILEKLRGGYVENDFLVNIVEYGYQNALQNIRLKQLENNKKITSNFDYVKNSKSTNSATSCEIKKELSLYLSGEKFCESQITIANYFHSYHSSASVEIFREKNRCNSEVYIYTKKIKINNEKLLDIYLTIHDEDGSVIKTFRWITKDLLAFKNQQACVYK